MGVPAFFRWLSDKFPKSVVDVVEQIPEEIEGVKVPIDTSQPNPNGIEFDNLYLDMNGIIHPCTHPEDGTAPKGEDEMMVSIMELVDRLFNIVRPRKMLYMAIDGVAPRAKMNQQRSRRFRAVKAANDKKKIEDQIRKEMEEQGREVPPAEELTPHFDSNCITPGTSFMEKVAECLRYYASLRLTNDPGWAGVKVLLSDSNVPGEGEHKIMSYVRLTRSQPGYDPNTKHVICGLDADLIMLGLGTHEAHFSILREEVTFGKAGGNNNCFICGQPGHRAAECQGKPNTEEVKPKQKPYQFLHLAVVREYLRTNLHVRDLPFHFDFERALDDWVFLCFFVGNDFLPHLPTLEIRENALGKLTHLYKKILPMTGYITEHGELNLERLEVLLGEVAAIEDEILVKRLENERRRKQNVERRNSAKIRKYEADKFEEERNTESSNNFQAAALLKNALLGKIKPAGEEDDDDEATAAKSKEEEEEELKKKLGLEDTTEPMDDVRLGEEGWKERYYSTKFHARLDDAQFFQSLSTSYIEGLAWVLRYYYQGCCSWKWYYPYHYAPFASELVNVSKMKIQMDLGIPFQPFEQLMGVLPAGSGQLVPPKYRELMSDPDSEIIDFYPEDFEVDMNGKKMEWQGVALLPFIDEKRLLKALDPRKPTLTDEEVERNSFRTDLLMVNASDPLAPVIEAVNHKEKDQDKWEPLDPKVSKDMWGYISRFNKAAPVGSLYSPPVENLEAIPKVMAAVCQYKFPDLPEGGFVRGILKGTVPPPPVLQSDDFVDIEADPNNRRNYQPRQNSAANRMINHYVESNQYKPMRHQQHHRDHPYERRDDNRRGGYNDHGGNYNNNYNRNREYQSHNQNDDYNNNRGQGRGGYNNHQQHHQNRDYQSDNRRNNYNNNYNNNSNYNNNNNYNNRKREREDYDNSSNRNQRGYSHNRNNNYQQQPNLTPANAYPNAPVLPQGNLLANLSSLLSNTNQLASIAAPYQQQAYNAPYYPPQQQQMYGQQQQQYPQHQQHQHQQQQQYPQYPNQNNNQNQYGNPPKPQFSGQRPQDPRRRN